jgi:diacylglycerol kinase (ATP)
MQNRSWIQIFVSAWRGIGVAVRSERNFTVHIIATIAAISLAWLLQITLAEWAILTLSIALVWCAELLNSGLERLAKAITSEFNAYVRDALDMAAGAVFVAALGAIGVGICIFAPRLWALLP